MPLKPLPRSFFARSPVEVAPELLGQILIREQEGLAPLRARIVEVEAYLGADDAAAHSARGRTRRNEVLFGPPGHAYVYLIYGMHLCLNVSTEREGRAGCVLFRALAPVVDEGEAGAAEGAAGMRFSGPGRLTRALAITRDLNGADLTRRGPLWVAAAASGGTKSPAGGGGPQIKVTGRIGITQSRELPLRFCLSGEAAVTRPREPVLRTITRGETGRNRRG